MTLMLGLPHRYDLRRLPQAARRERYGLLPGQIGFSRFLPLNIQVIEADGVRPEHRVFTS
jgi:hypothetical protein